MKFSPYYIFTLLLAVSYGLDIEAGKPTTTTVTVTVTVSPTKTTTTKTTTTKTTTTSKSPTSQPSTSKTSTSKTTTHQTTTSKTKTSKTTSTTKTTLTTKTTSSQTGSSEPCAPTAPAGTQSLYGQCGGLNYCGPTNCPKGAYCRDGLLDENPFYSQCVASTTRASDPVVTSTVITTVTVKPPTSGITYTTVTMTVTANSAAK